MTTDGISPLAGTLPTASMLVDTAALESAYYEKKPDPADPAGRVSFGTSGHRGTSLDGSFTESHILAITQAICDYRAGTKVAGPLFAGFDTHALSMPAFRSALEVLAANGVVTFIAAGDAFTPTPAVSHAILGYNRGLHSERADGIVITPSHNPPADGGFKYNPFNGGPADTAITGWIQNRANAYLERGLEGVKRMPYEKARAHHTTYEHDYIGEYVQDLENVIDFDVIRGAGLKLAVDPLGGAGVHYWGAINDRYGIALDIVSEQVDPRFPFMSLDWDGKIRMDPSSAYAMQRLIRVQDNYDVAFACDTDHDRHGIVTRSSGLLPSNHYLAVMIDYLFRERTAWGDMPAVGKTVVSTALIDRVAARAGRRVYEVPVGFKWFAQGLFDGTLGFTGEESAGASFLRRDGTVWTTDKDGITAALLAAEITARTGRDPGELYNQLTTELGVPYSNRTEAVATTAQKKKLSALAASDIASDTLAGEKILQRLERAPGNDAAIGGIKVITESGWFAARPSGTEDIYKIYAESFRSEEHLNRILEEAQQIVDSAISAP